MKVLLVLGCQIVYCHNRRRYLPGIILQQRLDKAIEAYRQIGNDCIIIVSGGATPGREATEADVMKRYLVEQGLPKYKIFEENNSLNTVENCLYSFRLIDNMKGQLTYQEVTSPNPFCNYYGADRFGFIRNFDLILVVSSDFHIPRVRKIFTHFNQGNELAFLSAETPAELLPACLEKEELIDLHRMILKYDRRELTRSN